MAIALITSAEWVVGSNGGTSTPIDTTGATFLVINVSWYTGGSPNVVSDSKGNIWTALTSRTIGNIGHRFYYSDSGIVGTGHTFTVTGSNLYPYLAIIAYNGSGIGPESENGATNSGTSPLSTGSVTPTANGSLIVSGWAGMNNAINPAVGSGLTIRQTNNSAAGISISGAVADLIQTTAAAINPSWSWSGVDHVAVGIAVFKEFGPATNVRVTQDVIELISSPNPALRVTQDVVEIISVGYPDVRVSQNIIEILASTTASVITPPAGGETTQFMIITL